MKYEKKPKKNTYSARGTGKKVNVSCKGITTTINRHQEALDFTNKNAQGKKKEQAKDK